MDFDKSLFFCVGDDARTVAFPLKNKLSYNYKNSYISTSNFIEKIKALAIYSCQGKLVIFIMHKMNRPNAHVIWRGLGLFVH